VIPRHGYLWLIAAGTATLIAAGAQWAARARRRRRLSRDRRDWTGRHNLDRRIAAEFVEMPGMALTLAQASRLLGLPLSMCERVLGTLVAAGVLRYTKAGHYARAEGLA
jgi:Fic family protein